MKEDNEYMNRTLIKKIPGLLVSFMILNGCWQDILISPLPEKDGEAVEFGTYLGRSALTRAVTIDNDNIGGCGFGVNAWHSGLVPFEDFVKDNPLPNFMNNTRVYDEGAGWTYSPLKYWPNNPYEMLSFVAYAPYNMLIDGNGDVSRNDNIIVDGSLLTYKVANEVKEQVDLLWSDDNEYRTIDMERQSVDEKVTFYFRHALSKITFTVEAAVDEVEAGSNVLDENTEVFVRKVALIGADDAYSEAEGWLTDGGPFHVSGKLDLVTGDWTGKMPGQRFLFTSTHFVDEKELVLDSTNSSEPQTLLDSDSYLMIIPDDGDGATEFKVYIEYDVVTVDPDATADYDDGSTITNRITSDETLSMDFQQGKAYNLNLILGMTSAKLDVNVNDWVDEENGNTAVSEDEDLPGNTK